MSKLLQIKESPMELSILAQKIKCHGYTKCPEIAINALNNITSKDLILFKDPSIGLEERLGKSKKRSNSFPLLDLGI